MRGKENEQDNCPPPRKKEKHGFPSSESCGEGGKKERKKKESRNATNFGCARRENDPRLGEQFIIVGQGEGREKKKEEET